MRERATDLYGDIVVQARTPYFYSDLDVPDTVEGRFDMITLHMFLVLRRLKQESDPAAKAFSQKLFDVMFKNMDHSLREMGVGDLSVGKKVRALAEAFYGRVGVYEEALGSEELPPLAAAIARNVFASEVSTPESEHLAKYIIASDKALKSQSLERLMLGIAGFLRVEETVPHEAVAVSAP